jgi:hypothetical protein
VKIFDAGREFVAQVMPGEERAAVAEMARICDREGIYLRTYVPRGRREVKNHRTHRYHVRSTRVCQNMHSCRSTATRCT